MTPEDMRVIAQVLAKSRISTIEMVASTTAMITCDLSDALRAAGGFDYGLFWELIEEEKRTEQKRVDAWIAEARARMGIRV